MERTDYEQLARLSIAESWKRRGEDAIFAAYLRDKLVAPVAAQALGIDSGEVYDAAMIWLAGLQGNCQLTEALVEVKMLRGMVDRYEGLVLDLLNQHNRLQARLLQQQRRWAIELLGEEVNGRL